MHETIFLTILHLKLYFKWNKIGREIAFEWQTRLIFWQSNFWKWQFVPENVCDRTVILACKIPYFNYGICMRTAEQISQILKKNYSSIYYVKRYKLSIVYDQKQHYWLKRWKCREQFEQERFICCFWFYSQFSS